MTLSRREPIENLDVDAIEDIAIIDVADYSSLWMDFAVAVAPLTAFTVEFRTTGLGNWLAMASVAGDYTTPNFPVVKASGSLVTAGVGNHWLRLNVQGIHSVRIRAAGASSTIIGNVSKG